MIEMLGVLAIVGVLSVAGIAGYSKAMGKFKINKAMDQVSTLAANIKTMYASVGTYASLTNDQAYKLALFPDEMVRGCSGATLTGATAFIDFLISAAHAAGGTGDECIRNGINGTASVTGNAADFSIEFTGVSKEACAAFVSSEWGGASGFRQLVVSGAGGDDGIKVEPSDTAESLFAAAANCNDCATSGCTATWTFY